MPSVNDGLRPATDGQVLLAARLLAELNDRSFRELRAWAAGTRETPEPEPVRMRLLVLIERFLAGQDSLRPIAAQIAAALLAEKPSSLQEWFDRLRPQLLRRAPEIVPWMQKAAGAVRASDFMASWGLAISDEHADRIEPPLRTQQRAIESGIKTFYERLRSGTPIDATSLADAALRDFEDLTEGLNQIKAQVVPSSP